MVAIAYSLDEPKRKRLKARPLGDFKEILGILFRKRRDVLYLMIFAAFLFTSMQTGFYFYQPYLVAGGLSIASIGAVFATFNLIAAASSKAAHSWEERLGFNKTLMALVGCLMAGYILMESFIAPFSFAFIYLHQIIRGIYNVVTQDYIHKRIESKFRATILSV